MHPVFPLPLPRAIKVTLNQSQLELVPVQLGPKELEKACESMGSGARKFGYMRREGPATDEFATTPVVPCETNLVLVAQMVSAPEIPGIWGEWDQLDLWEWTMVMVSPGVNSSV